MADNTREFTLSMPAKGSERIAILARRDKDSPWVQVESILGTKDDIDNFLDELEFDKDERIKYISEMRDEEWGEDAPIKMP